jgi:hypothetical protein
VRAQSACAFFVRAECMYLPVLCTLLAARAARSRRVAARAHYCAPHVKLSGFAERQKGQRGSCERGGGVKRDTLREIPYERYLKRDTLENLKTFRRCSGTPGQAGQAP